MEGTGGVFPLRATGTFFLPLPGPMRVERGVL